MNGRFFAPGGGLRAAGRALNPGGRVDATKSGEDAVTPGSRYRVSGSPAGEKSNRTDGDTQLLARAVNDLVRRTHFPVAFGGLERGDAIHVTSIAGARTRSLEGLVVQASRGLGGRALVEKRPRLALDYRSSRSITHDYDRAVLGEGISTLFAIPVLVGARARGVIYCGSWSSSPVGDVAARPAFAVAEELSSELRIREEVDRRLALAPPVAPAEASALAPAAREELRGVDRENVRAESRDLVVDALLRARARGQHRDDGAHADDDAEHRQNCAEQVRANRLQRNDHDLAKQHEVGLPEAWRLT